MSKMTKKELNQMQLKDLVSYAKNNKKTVKVDSKFYKGLGNATEKKKYLIECILKEKTSTEKTPAKKTPAKKTPAKKETINNRSRNTKKIDELTKKELVAAKKMIKEMSLLEKPALLKFAKDNDTEISEHQAKAKGNIGRKVLGQVFSLNCNEAVLLWNEHCQ